MATNYNANPSDVKNFTQNAEVSIPQNFQDYSEFLPVINRSESLQRFFGATVNQLLSSGSTQSVDAYWGRLSGRNYNPDNELFNLESDSLRLNYQLQPGVVSRNNGEAQETVSYINWLRRLESLGADLDNHDRLFSEPGYTLDLPVNSDMIVNYQNYYWLEGLPPILEISPSVVNPIDIDDIIGLSHYTTPILENSKTLKFATGLRIKFTGANATSTSGDYFADYVYYVENVGGEDGIQLVAIADDNGNNLFPSITPYEVEIREGWDTFPWDTTPWDGLGEFDEYNKTTTDERIDLNLNKSYIVMERWARDKNPWARTNKWFADSTIQIFADYLGTDAEAYLNSRTRAARPIVEFRANIELFNSCKNFVETVDYVLSIDQITEMVSGISQFNVDSQNAIQNGDIILIGEETEDGFDFAAYNQDFNNDFDSILSEILTFEYNQDFNNDFNSESENNDAFSSSYIVSGVGSNITLVPYNTYTDDDYVIVDNGEGKGEIYCLSAGKWSIAQNKTTRSTPPLFKLYDQFGTSLEDFPNNNFNGSKIFGYKVNPSGVIDRELGFKPEFTAQGSFNDYIFEWTMDQERFSQNVTVDTSSEIRGYYCWRDWVRDETFTGWSNIRGGQRVPVIQTQIADGVNNIVFNLGTTDVSTASEYTVVFQDGAYRWHEHSYIDRLPIGSPNPNFVWRSDTVYTINTLISDGVNTLEFVAPNGTTTNITTNVIDDTTITLSVASAYEFGKVLYRSQADASISGEIHISNDNQNRYSVYRNGQYLVEGIDYTFNGTNITVTAATQENDVVELFYISNSDLENVVYDVAPIHFYNSENNLFTEVGYDNLIKHMTRQMAAMPGFNGYVIGNNNYREILRDNAYDGLIRQQIFKTKNLQYLIDQEQLNPIRALKNFSNDYSQFKKTLERKVAQLWRTESWNSVRELLDEALRQINIGKSEQFKYAHSDMVYWTQFRNVTYSITDASTVFAMPDVINHFNDTQNHLQVFLREYDGSSKYVERPLVRGIDYAVDGVNIILNSAVTLNGSSDPATLTMRWFDYRQISHVPFSAVKLGFFRPTQVEIVDGVLIGHDGSRHVATGTEFRDIDSANFDVITAALYDFELRVYNNLVDAHFISDTLYNYEMGEFYPNPDGEFAYTIHDLNSRLDDWYNRWAVSNGVTEIDTVNYDAGDEFTWNYNTVGPNLGSWRSLYTYYFGTDRPHTHPWEMLGHRVKPIWWDATYSWTTGVQRTALLNALKYGVTGDASTPNKIDLRYARQSYDWDNDVLVTDDGTATLNGPVTANLVTAPVSVAAVRDFVFGEWSEVEDEWRKSSEYLFALAEVYLQLKPYRLFDLFWSLRRWNINNRITQEQWVDPDTCRRQHLEELHNQVITSGIISKVRILNSGTGYSSLDISFKEDSVCYRNASAEAYTNAGQVVGVSVIDPGRGFDNQPEVIVTGPLGSNGVKLEYVVDFEYHVTHLGFNTLSAEEYVDINPDSTDLSNMLTNLDINYMIHVGGFTDKRILSLELDGDYNSGIVRIPESSYDILIDRNPPIKTVFYSGVRIEKVEGQGYRVDGYNLDSKFFNYYKPSTAGSQTTVSVGNVEVVKHLNWRNEISQLPYRKIVTKRQDLYQLLLGIGKYYEDAGFNNFSQWEVEAKAAIEWALSTDAEPFFVNGIDEILEYHQGEQGIVQTVDVNYDGVPNILDSDYKKIRRAEMQVLRNNETTEFSLKSGADRIFGLGVKVIEFEHIIVVDNNSVFNDLFYQPEIGIGQNRLRVVGEKTRNWNGRIEAPGYLVKNNGLILNMESSVRELEQDWVSAESKALERLTRQTIGFNVGYSKPTYMTNTFIGDRSAYKFEKGRRKYKGTASAIEAMTRSKNIFGQEFEHNLYEEWMVRLGDYGDVSERNSLEFAVDNNKIKGDPQIFRFNNEFVSDKVDDLIIDLHKSSADAISGNYDNPFAEYPILRIDNTSIEDLEDYQNFNRDAGLPLVTEIDYFLGSIDDIGDIYDPTADYAMIPNWSETSSYVQGDLVRYFGGVYRLRVESTGLTTLNDDITIRGTQVFPQVQNGLTFIANNESITFLKTNDNITTDTIQIDGSVINPTVPSGSTLTVDGVNVNFIKTQQNTTYSDIILTGNVTLPTIINSASRQLEIYYANTAAAPLSTVTVNFNELSATNTIQQILLDALDVTVLSSPITEANNRIAIFEAFRSPYVAANSAADWETNVVQAYFNTTPFVNPEVIGALVLANPGASWETQARDLIQLDLDLLTALAGTHTETVATIVSGSLNDVITFNADLATVNALFDTSTNNTLVNRNLEQLVQFLETNGNVAITAGQTINIPLTDRNRYVTDNLSDIVDKINTALINASAPVDILASAVADRLVLTRNNNTEGNRLGIEDDSALGFLGQTDVQTSGTTTVDPVDLTLTEAVTAINNASISGVSAISVNNRIRVLSTNPSINIANSTAIDDLGLPVGVVNATTNTVSVPVNLSIGDVVSQINVANIPDLRASQADGALILTYTGETLTIGEGTANAELGLSAQTFESLTDTVQNVFVENDWEIIRDPVNFNIWLVDTIGSNPSEVITNTASYNVLQTLDFNLGVIEICAGEENGDDALVKVDNPHQLNSGDYVLIVNSTCIPSVDGIHQVTTLQGNNAFYIDRYIDQKGFTGKIFLLRSVRFSTSDEAKLAMKYGAGYTLDRDGLNLGIRTGSYVYVDDVVDSQLNSLGYGGVYIVDRSQESVTLKEVRRQEPYSNNSVIKNGVLYSNSTGDTVIIAEVFDPLKGIIPGIADREIDLRSEYDLANYNNTTDPEVELRPNNAWGEAQVGTVWWDLKNAIYLNYDQSDAAYRQNYWGELFPTSTIDIYEWTKSPVTPDEYENAVRAGTTIDGIELTGIPYALTDQFGEIQYNWCEEVEINPNTNQLETYYYFWVSNKTTTPTLEREFSVLQLAEIVRDPASQQINWLAAAGSNTLIVSGLTQTTGYNDLVMQVNFNTYDSDYHQEFILLAENDPATIIPEWLHIGLRDSLAGFTQATGTYEYTTWNSLSSYQVDAVVLSGNGNAYRAHIANTNQDPDLDANNNYWTQLPLIEINPDGEVVNNQNKLVVAESRTIPDRGLHPYARYGLETRPHQVWFKDYTQANKSLIEKLNSQFAKLNLVDGDIPWREEFERTFTVDGVEFDISDYWNYVDWSLDGTVYERGVGDYFVDTVSELAILNPSEGEIAQVNSSNDFDEKNDRRQVYRYTAGEWVLVYKEKATIKFNELIWNINTSNYGWDVAPWDTTPWDESASEVIVKVFDSIYNHLWIDEYSGLYNDLWFHMAKYILTEQQEVDWLFKTSYFKLIAEDSLEKQFNKFFNQSGDEFFDYVETVKPFRSKMRESILRKNADEDTAVSALDTVEIRIQTNPDDNTIDETNTRSFRLSIGSNDLNYSSQIINSEKVLLALAVNPDDTAIAYFTSSLGTLDAGGGAIWINGERIEYTGTTLLLADLVGFDGASGFDSSFVLAEQGLTLLTGVTRGTQGTFARSHEFASVIEQETVLVENTSLNDYANTITPAWNELGDGLLDIANSDNNGTTIRGNGFGTIDLYGDLLSFKWIVDGQTAAAIEDFQSELSYLIENY